MGEITYTEAALAKHIGGLYGAPRAIAFVPGLRDISRRTPRLIGIYFLCDGNRNVAYIGQSTNALVRVMQHREKKEFEHAYFMPCGVRRLTEIETALIRVFKPKLNGLNGRYGAPARDQDLRFAAEVGVRASEVQRWLDSLQDDGKAA